jgi:hypothetical protein
MPPQQGQTLLDLIGEMRDLGSHGGLRASLPFRRRAV